jgi:hypothetical protein
MQRYLARATSGYFGAHPLLDAARILENGASEGLARGLAAAHEAFGDKQPVALFIVQQGEGSMFDQHVLEYELLERCVLPPVSGSGSLLIARRQTRRPGRSADTPRARNLHLSLAHLPPPPRPPHLAHAADDLDDLPPRWLHTHRLRSLHARLDQAAAHGDQGELGGHVDLETSSSCSSSSLDSGGLPPPLVVGEAEGEGEDAQSIWSSCSSRSARAGAATSTGPLSRPSCPLYLWASARRGLRCSSHHLFGHLHTVFAL